MNQAASNALMERLEAQRAICNASEKELHKKFKLRDEVEKQVRSQQWDQTRKRLRTDSTALERKEDETEEFLLHDCEKGAADGIHNESIFAMDDDNKVPIEDKLEAPKIIAEKKPYRLPFPNLQEQEVEEEDEERRRERGKGNVEKWLQILLGNSQKGEEENETSKIDGSITNLNLKHSHKERRLVKVQDLETREGNKKFATKETYSRKKKEEIDSIEARKPNVIEKTSTNKGVGSGYCSNERERRDKSGKERKLAMSESVRTFKRTPSSSPSIIQGMRKGEIVKKISH